MKTVALELAQRIRKTSTNLLDDPIWGESLSVDVIWEKELAEDLVEDWTEDHWERFGLRCDMIRGFWLLPALMSCDATFEFLWLRYKKHENFREEMHQVKTMNLSVRLFEILAKERFSSARAWVAENPNCPIELLEVLVKDSVRDISYKAHNALAERDLKRDGP